MLAKILITLSSYEKLTVLMDSKVNNILRTPLATSEIIVSVIAEQSLRCGTQQETEVAKEVRVATNVEPAL